MSEHEQAVLVVTTEAVPDHRIVRTLGLVGVRPDHHEAQPATTEGFLGKLVEAAQRVGANAVVAVRRTFSNSGTLRSCQ